MSERPRRRFAVGVAGVAAVCTVVLVVQAATSDCDAAEAVSFPLLVATWALLAGAGVLALSGSWVRMTVALRPYVLALVVVALCALSALVLYVVVEFAYTATCPP